MKQTNREPNNNERTKNKNAKHLRLFANGGRPMHASTSNISILLLLLVGYFRIMDYHHIRFGFVIGLIDQWQNWRRCAPICGLHLVGCNAPEIVLHLFIAYYHLTLINSLPTSIADSFYNSCRAVIKPNNQQPTYVRLNSFLWLLLLLVGSRLCTQSPAVHTAIFSSGPTCDRFYFSTEMKYINFGSLWPWHGFKCTAAPCSAAKMY